ncbi:helix-turn-helix domain-containing protein [Glutamicibacter sp. MNS18]|nr:helix-turn-helix domain-containing protein [Glutamicibacter sp. MNS18]
MYTVTQVASLLEISGMTVYRLIKTGELSAVQFGKSVKISKEAEPVRKFV